MDATERADGQEPPPGPSGAESIGRRLLRQRMFPGHTDPIAVERYVLLSFAGSGGMGEVYAAYDPVLDRKVALKLLPHHVGGDAERRARLLREAQALAKLSHPNVVQVYGAGEHDERVFMAMEFVEGQTLSDYLTKARPSAREVLQLFVVAGRGLAAAHAAGLVHRDFKPSNVRIDGEGVPRVLDFGLVQGEPGEPEGSAAASASLPEAVRALDVELTATGAFLGTPAYMAPEQVAGDHVDARADQFAFCVALAEALTGARPFEAPSLVERWERIQNEDTIEWPTKLGVPRRVRRAIERGLSRDRRERWPSMDLLLDALEPPARLRSLGLAAAIAAPLVAVGGWAIVQSYERELDSSAEQLAVAQEQTEAESARAERSDEAKALLGRAQRAVRVHDLARSPGRELEALALGVEVLGEYAEAGEAEGEDYEAAVHGLSLALDGMVPVAELDAGAAGSRTHRLVAKLALSADGETLVTTPMLHRRRARGGSGELERIGENTLELWSTSPPALERSVDLGRLELGVRAPVLSADGRRVAVSSGDRCAVYAVDSGESLQELEGCTDPHFSTDGATLFGQVPCADPDLAGERDPACAVAAWSVDSGERRWKRALAGRSAALLSAPASAGVIVREDFRGGEALALRAIEDGATRVRFQREGAGAPPSSRAHAAHLALSGDGSTLAAVEHDADGRVAVWDLTELGDLADLSGSVTLEGRVVESVAPTSWGWWFSNLALSHDGSELLTHGRGAGLGLFDLERDRVLHAQSWGSSTVAALPSGWLGISGSEWLELPRPESRQPATPARQLVASADGRFVATVSDLGASLWTAERAAAPEVWPAPEGEELIAFDGERAVTRGEGQRYRVYPRSGEGPVREDDSLAGIYPVMLAAERVDRALVQLDGHVEVRELGGSTLCRLPGDPGLAWTISRDGRLAARDSGERVDIWEVDSCRERERVALPSEIYVLQTVTNAGALHLRTGHGHNLIHHADGSEQIIDQGCAYDQPTAYATLSPDGALLVGSCDAEAPETNPGQLWSTDTGEPLGTLDLREYRGVPRFSADGGALVFGVDTRRVAIVDVATGRERFRVLGRLGHGGKPEWVGDATHFELAVFDGGIARMPLEVEGLVDAACSVLGRSELAERAATPCAAD
ncbi:serine/threonine kinase family protein [Plesiocystis pacifica SIR-1]|uniref:Serine/threonine kinase family protein n=1 Tax=Plesiocystis pacifica SIR-1 TaxID=391625 RepID=A6G0G4_9BACT|nr:serine/threonine-protein kinase [Plesiocystis pacifica]EDM80610.1 serine/threonine kinase family protein [Plesiocystis pacifica SIR-1]